METLDGDALRAALIEAASSGNDNRLAELCTTHHETIRRDFGAWTTVPVEVRADAAAVQRYAGTLIKVAQVFATRLSDPALLRMMTGPQESNPIADWQRALGQARRLMGAARFDEARQLLSHTAAELDGVTGSAVDQILPVTHGMLGECLFQLGEAASAVGPTTTALRLCEELDDQAGVRAYLENLVEMYRYLGRAEEAADAASRYADVLARSGPAGPAAQRRRQAQLLRAGEPLNRVVAVIGDDRYELDDLPRVRDSRVGFVFQRNRLTLEPSRRRTAEGEQLAGQGRLAEASEAFGEAARLDPFDPHPHYLCAQVLLDLRRYAEAVAEYETTERLAPGWFHCRADLWLARELAGGTLTHELFQVVYRLEDASMPPAEKAKAAEAALREAPRLPALHLLHGRSLAALGAARKAEDAYRNGLAHATEPDIRTRLLVALALASRSKSERQTLLTEAAATPDGNLVAAATAIVALRSDKPRWFR
ncbi:hypothetical protein ACQPZX_20475 [Actinoplanes sp. CA-142083]|uniref:hypothetical protein n=1 Tax=Actinoplanes sp. CA-142083 TaxID=3239903 RepID=UPI003D8A5D32